MSAPHRSVDHYPTSVPIGIRDDLGALRERLARQLERHRGTSTMMGEGVYKNLVRDGFDRGLSHAIAEIDRALNTDSDQ